MVPTLGGGTVEAALPVTRLQPDRSFAMKSRIHLPIRRDEADDHEPHLPHETPRGVLTSIGVAAAIGAAILAGTLALFG